MNQYRRVWFSNLNTLWLKLCQVERENLPPLLNSCRVPGTNSRPSGWKLSTTQQSNKVPDHIPLPYPKREINLSTIGYDIQIIAQIISGVRIYDNCFPTRTIFTAKSISQLTFGEHFKQWCAPSFGSGGAAYCVPCRCWYTFRGHTKMCPKPQRWSWDG